MLIYDMPYIASAMIPLQPPPMARPPLTGATTGARILEARKAAGFKSRTKFAARLGAGYQTVYDWERDKYRPRADSLQAIAEATGYSVTEILGGNGPVHPALEDFLETPFADDLTEAELAQLRAYPWTGEPTIQTYHFMLLALRAQLEPDEAARAAKTTEAALGRADKKGLTRRDHTETTPKKRSGRN